MSRWAAQLLATVPLHACQPGTQADDYIEGASRETVFPRLCLLSIAMGATIACADQLSACLLSRHS